MFVNVISLVYLGLELFLKWKIKIRICK